ncbi:hypothetical protein F5Y17DRAFT_149216 [Xylariaceae sp. FL0594]|nr:hypothetical protein F5Y17DRAFT_149216 [Xylariaceae sp. FL0594]
MEPLYLSMTPTWHIDVYPAHRLRQPQDKQAINQGETVIITGGGSGIDREIAIIHDGRRQGIYLVLCRAAKQANTTLDR